MTQMSHCDFFRHGRKSGTFRWGFPIDGWRVISCTKLYFSVCSVWVFPKIGVGPQNGWFIMENPIKKWMIWGVFPLFLETPILFHLIAFPILGPMKWGLFGHEIQLCVQDAISISTVVSALEAMNGGNVSEKNWHPEGDLAAFLWSQSGSGEFFCEQFPGWTLWQSVGAIRWGMGKKVGDARVRGYRPLAQCHMHLARCTSWGFRHLGATCI